MENLVSKAYLWRRIVTGTMRAMEIVKCGLSHCTNVILEDGCWRIRDLQICSFNAGSFLMLLMNFGTRRRR